MKTPILLVLLLVPASSSRAQESNADLLARLGVECVARALPDPETVALKGPDRLPFIRSALVNTWIARGVAVLEAEAIADRRVVRVAAAVEVARVTYGRSSSGLSDRTVELGLRLAVSAADGTVLYDDLCTNRFSDRVEPSAFDRLENPVFPETVGTRPPRGFFHRVIQPAVIGAASAVGVLLFFSLRSRRAPTDG